MVKAFLPGYRNDLTTMEIFSLTSVIAEVFLLFVYTLGILNANKRAEA